MSETKPGADELRIRGILRQNGVGPDAIPPKPEDRARDWLDDILDAPAPAPAPEEPPTPAPATGPQPTTARKTKPKTSKKRKRKRSKRQNPAAARSAWDAPPASPRQSLADALDRVPYRLKWLAYHASATYLGWSTGLVDYATYVTTWIADTGLIGVQAAFWYGAGAATVLLYRHTRGWWWPTAWLAAVPACSTVVGVLLYAPNS